MADRAQKIQILNLIQQLKSSIGLFTEAELEYKAKHQIQLQKQYLIGINLVIKVHPGATSLELDELLSFPPGKLPLLHQELFKDLDVQKTLIEIQNRFAEIKQLEMSVLDFGQIIQQLSEKADQMDKHQKDIAINIEEEQREEEKKPEEKKQEPYVPTNIDVNKEHLVAVRRQRCFQQVILPSFQVQMDISHSLQY